MLSIRMKYLRIKGLTIIIFCKSYPIFDTILHWPGVLGRSGGKLMEEIDHLGRYAWMHDTTPDPGKEREVEDTPVTRWQGRNPALPCIVGDQSLVGLVALEMMVRMTHKIDEHIAGRDHISIPGQFEYKWFVFLSE